MPSDTHVADTVAGTDLLPTVFISHGAPTLALEDGPARRMLCGLGARLGNPQAILVISAHWESSEVRVLGNPAPPTIHDFFGFPEPLYGLRYPAPGAVALAHRVCELLGAAGYPVALDDSRGYDHGVWVPLSLIYPEAAIPVTQISIDPQKPPAYHWRLGRVLAALRSQGVLIVGSGSLTHNLQDFRRMRGGVAPPVEPYAEAFTDWFDNQLKAGDLDALLAYRTLAPAAVRAHPSDEHLMPLFAALGAAGVSWTAERVHHGFIYGAIAMDSFLFHPSAGLAA